MYFHGIYIAVQAVQRNEMNGKLFEFVIGLRLYGYRTLPDHIYEGNYVLTKNG